MLSRKTIIKLTLLVAILFAGVTHIAAARQQASLTEAFRLFNEGNFEQALPAFRALIERNPDDPLLHYYYGASRTETGHFSNSDLEHLQKAQEGEPPEKINYYLGMQYHAQEEWTNALRFYNRFQLNATTEERQELAVAQKIQQCFNTENPYTLLPDDEVADAPPVDQPQQPRAQTNEFTTIERVDRISFENNQIENLPDNKPIEFLLNTDIVYYNTSNFKSTEALRLFEESEELERKLNFVVNEVESLRRDYRNTADAEEKKMIGARIVAFENESFELKSEINQTLTRVRELENEYWQNASRQEIEDFNAEASEILAAREEAPRQETPPETTEENNPATVDPNLLFQGTETIDLFDEPEETEDELVYKIQIGSYSRGLPAYVERLFNKLSLIRKIDNYTDDEGIVVYTTGNLQNLDDAIKMRDQVRQEGVEDAFVVPYFNGKRITLEEAKKLETGS